MASNQVVPFDSIRIIKFFVDNAEQTSLIVREYFTDPTSTENKTSDWGYNHPDARWLIDEDQLELFKIVASGGTCDVTQSPTLFRTTLPSFGSASNNSEYGSEIA